MIDFSIRSVIDSSRLLEALFSAGGWEWVSRHDGSEYTYLVPPVPIEGSRDT